MFKQSDFGCFILFVILKGKPGKPLINHGRKFKCFPSPLKNHNKTCST